MVLLNPAVTASALNVLVLAATVTFFFVAIGVVTSVPAGIIAWGARRLTAWAGDRRFISTLATAGAAAAAAVVYNYNGAAYALSVPALAGRYCSAYAIFFAAVACGLVINAVLTAARVCRGVGPWAVLVLAPALAFTVPLATHIKYTPPHIPYPTSITRRAAGFKIYVVGIDGLDPEVFLPLARAGRTPYLTALTERGTWSRLQTIPPGLSPAIWTTIATGQLPRDHGITDYEYLKIKGVATALRVFPSRTFLGLLAATPLADLEQFSNADRQEPAFWNVASAAGARVAVAGWHTTTPPDKINGVMISDFYHSRGYPTAWPPDIGATLRGFAVPPGQYDREAERKLLPPNTKPFAAELFYKIYAEGKTAENIGSYIVNLRRGEGDFELTAFYFNPCDALQHLYWGFRPEVGLATREEERAYGDVVNRAYEWADEYAREVIGAADDRTVIMIVSDHGFRTASWWRRWYYRLWQNENVTGVHDVTPPPAGLIIAAGGPVKKGARLRNPSVVDVAPNVLYLLGFPVPEDMPGRVWTEIYEPNFLREYPLRKIKSYRGIRWETAAVEEDTKSLAERRRHLKSLGYVK